MNTGVEILLKRMESNPEDFDYQPQYGSPSRWMRLADHACEIATTEERDALEAGLKEVRRVRFTELVMKELAGVEDETSEQGKWADSVMQAKGITLGGVTLGQYTSATTGTTTINANSLTLGNTTLSEAGLRQMLATHKLMRIEKKQKHWWNKSIPELLGKK